MLPILIIACGLFWFGVTLYWVVRRGFTVFLIWLLIAPLVLYLWANAGGGFSERRPEPEEEFQVQSKKKQIVVKRHYLDALEGQNNQVRVREFLEPHRLISGVFLIGLVLHLSVRRKRLGKLDGAEICMALFAVMLLVNVVFKSDLLRFALRLATDAFLVHLFAYFLFRRFVTTEERFAAVVRVLGYVGVYLICMALVERILHSDLLYRVEGPFSHRDRLYVVIIVAFFAVFAENVRGQSTTWRNAVLPAAARWFVIYFAPVIVVLTLTRGNWLGFALAIWVCLAFASRLVDLPRKLVSAGLLLLLLPVLFAGWQALLPERVIEDRLSQPTNVYARLASWYATLNLFGDNPVLGVGLNNSRRFLEARAVTFEGAKNLRSVHNSFLAMLAELGLIGFLAYLAIIGCLVQMAYRLYRDGPDLRDRWRGLAAIGILAAYLVPALFSGLLYMPTVSHTYVFVYMGALAGLYGRSQRRRNAQLVNCAIDHQRGIPLFSAPPRKVGWA